MFVHAKNLFVETKPPGRGKCAARKDLLSGHQAIDGGSLLLNCRSHTGSTPSLASQEARKGSVITPLLWEIQGRVHISFIVG